jgi:hypothetical protein
MRNRNSSGEEKFWTILAFLDFIIMAVSCAVLLYSIGSLNYNDDRQIGKFKYNIEVLEKTKALIPETFTLLDPSIQDYEKKISDIKNSESYHANSRLKSILFPVSSISLILSGILLLIFIIIVRLRSINNCYLETSQQN